MDKGIIKLSDIENLIYTVRDVQVMFDFDLAEMYGVKTKRLNEQVKRNIDRFPEAFRFQVTELEYENLRSQFATSKRDTVLRSQFATSNSEHGGRRYLPYVFTEQGVAMLSAVLRSDTAVKVSIQIMQAFVQMRKMLATYSGIFQRLDKIERKQIDADSNFEKIFDAMASNKLIPKQGIFFEGQVFDAYELVSRIIRTATKSVVLIDNYIDETSLIHLSKKKKGVSVLLLTKNENKQLKLDVKKANEQFGNIELKFFNKSHDRFLIIDNTEVYHLGASLKDLGRKWFAFSKMDKNSVNSIMLSIAELL